MYLSWRVMQLTTHLQSDAVATHLDFRIVTLAST